MIGDWSFARPWVLVALALVPLFVAWRGRRLARARLPYAPLQYRRPPGARRVLARLLLPCEALLLAVLIVAVAGPMRVERIELFDEEGIDVVLVLDISLSMLATDFPPNRLEALRATTRDFIARAGGNRLGLVVFAADTYVHTPLTRDQAALAGLLDGVTVHAINQAKSGGTAIGDALLVAGRQLERGRVEGRDQAVVLVTDGESNVGVEPVLAARYLRDLGIRFYAIGIGGEEPVEVFFEGRRVGGDSPYQAVLDSAELEAMATAADGRFYRATEAGALEEVLAELSRLERAPLERREIEVRGAATHLPAGAALLLLTAQLVLAGLVVRRPMR